jgi:hypothetical protein
MMSNALEAGKRHMATGRGYTSNCVNLDYKGTNPA